MSDLTFDFQLAQSLYSSEEQFPINFDDAWRWLEYGTKYDAKVSFTKSGFTKSIDFISFQESSGKPQGGRPSEKIYMSVDCFKTWAMMSGTTKGKEVRLYFLECEKIAKDKLAQTITKEVTSVEKVKQFNEVIDSIFSNTHIVPELISGVKLNTAKKYLPSLAPELEESRQLLINSTATTAKLLTVTEIGKLLNPPLSAVKTNYILTSKGYQIKNPNKNSQKDLTYIPTDKAKDHCSVTLATGTSKNDTYQQLRWYDSIVSLIQN